ncbi:MAG: hypothetical protein R6W85_05960 [Gillisia sp.]
MKFYFLFGLMIVTSAAMAQDTTIEIPAAEIQIKTALLAAPADQRSEAMVYGYNSEGELQVLQEGTNNLVCIADDPNREGINVSCYNKKLEPFMARGRELTAEGKSEMEKRAIRQQEAESGILQLTDTPSMVYILSGTKENYDKTTGTLIDGKFRYVIYMPYATTESTGLPAKPEVPGMPWLMDPGTHRAHIMITPENK